MEYLHCPSCAETAWLDTTVDPPLRCRRCEAELAPMPAPVARSLTAAVQDRFERDVQRDAGRPRFVRG
jgi:hypothetical protein